VAAGGLLGLDAGSEAGGLPADVKRGLVGEEPLAAAVFAEPVP
jgi:hypothetical protein